MSDKAYTKIVLDEIAACLSAMKEDELADFAGEICHGRHIFCDGAGRSRLKAEGFAMRLVQMGFSGDVVGLPTAPAITSSDVLLVCSASGETPMLVSHARIARELGARVLLVTTAPDSSLAKICDRMICIRASSKNLTTAASIQPMGSLFEQCLGILLDILVLHLMERHEINNEIMAARHANLE